MLLIACISLYIFKEEEKKLRIYAEGELNQVIERKKIIEDNLITTAKAKDGIEKELNKKSRQVRLTLNILKREITTRRQAEARLVTAIMGKEILEERIKQFKETPRTVELEKIVIKPASELVGKILVVNKEYAFIALDLGSRDNLKLGEVLSIYRNDEFIGRVQLERVEEKISAAAILPEWKNVEFKENDMVKKL